VQLHATPVQQNTVQNTPAVDAMAAASGQIAALVLCLAFVAGSSALPASTNVSAPAGLGRLAPLGGIDSNCTTLLNGVHYYWRQNLDATFTQVAGICQSVCSNCTAASFMSSDVAACASRRFLAEFGIAWGYMDATGCYVVNGGG
jgi:hypothetical protein